MINLQGIIQLLNSGKDPSTAFNQMLRQNPAVNQAMQILNGKNQQQQYQLLEDMARQRGTTLQKVAQQMGIPWK